MIRSRLFGLVGLACLGSIFFFGEAVAQEDPSLKPRSLNDPLTEQEKETPVDNYVTPDQIAREAFDPPPDAKLISKRNTWIDREKKRVYVDGYVAMRDGPLEMFACPMATKEHESIVGTLARASEVHAALLAIGSMPGTPVQYMPNFVPATGQRVRVWVCYRDEQGKFFSVDARSWIQKAGTKSQMESDWVFAGSGFWKDPQDGKEFYLADSGDMICVSNFSTAMLDVPIASSAQADNLQFTPFTDRIPKRGTPLRLVLAPIPIPTDKPADPNTTTTPSYMNPNQPPSEGILPVKSKPVTKTEPNAPVGSP